MGKSKMYVSHKGYSLIEIVIAVSIFSILSFTTVRIFTLSSTALFKGIKEDRIDFYINDGFGFIEMEMNENNKNVDVADNSIVLERFPSKVSPAINSVDYIRLRGQNIVIEYYKNGIMTSHNVILRNVEEFSVVKDGYLVYLTIKFEGEPGRERCIGLRNLKN